MSTRHAHFKLRIILISKCLYPKAATPTRKTLLLYQLSTDFIIPLYLSKAVIQLFGGITAIFAVFPLLIQWDLGKKPKTATVLTGFP